MAQNLSVRVRPNLLGQVPASPIKLAERLDFGEAFIADFSRDKHLIRNKLKRDSDD